VTHNDRLQEIGEYLRYLMTEWPAVRPALEGKLAPRCRRCILSDRCVPLADGVCELCRKPAAARATRDHAGMTAALSAILHEHEGKGRGRYDALVLFSGGKDSAYLLHRLTAEHPGLRLLAVTIDNGFFSPVAMANARYILEQIDVDHLTHKPKASLYKTTFRHAFTHLNAGGCYTTVDRMDGDLAFDLGRNLAATLDIPLMIAGLSPEQVERILGLSWFETPREAERVRRTVSAGFTLDDLYTGEDRKAWWDGTAWPESRVPRVLYPFYAWPYDEEQVRKKVVDLGLIPPGADNPLATNNDTIPVMLAVDVNRMGYSGFEPEFAELIRTGRSSREMWLPLFESLEHLGRQGKFLPKCVDDTLSRLTLTRQDVGIPEAVS
jgi:hypothetical protein